MLGGKPSRQCSAIGLCAAVIMACGSAMSSGALGADDKMAARIRTARHLMSTQDYGHALVRLNRVLATAPDNPEARFLAGLVFAKTAEYKTALALFEGLAEDYPDMVEIWTNLGVLRARTGDLDGAGAALARATLLDPEYLAAQENMGEIYIALAHAAYRNALALAPDDTDLSSRAGALVALLNPASGVPVHAGLGRKAAAGDDVGAIRGSLRRWAAAWSVRDLDAYFAAYSDAFEPTPGVSMQQWRANGVRRVRDTEHTLVQLENIEISITGEDTATAYFEQLFASGGKRYSVRTSAELRREPQGWRIIAED